MFIVIGIMFAGIAFGYILRTGKIGQGVNKTIRYTIYLLLFFLGISVGGDKQIVMNFPALGGQALLLAFAGTSGSVLAAWGVGFLFFKKGAKKNNTGRAEKYR